LRLSSLYRHTFDRGCTDSTTPENLIFLCSAIELIPITTILVLADFGKLLPLFHYGQLPTALYRNGAIWQYNAALHAHKTALA
jgi:hypothetical protein